MSQLHSLRIPIQIRYSDFDMMGHLNNSAYVTYLEIARLQFLTKLFAENSYEWTDVVANLNLNYRKPVRPTHKPVVFIKCSRIGNSSYDLDYWVVDIENESHIYAEGKTIQVCVDAKTQTPIPLPPEARKILENVRVQ